MKKGVKQFLILISLSIFVTACFDLPKDAIMPNWDVDVNVPLTSDKVTMMELLDPESSDFLGIYDSVGVDDSLYFLFVDDIENTSPIAHSIVINPAPFPSTLHAESEATGDTVSTGIVFNPDQDYHLIAANFSSGSFRITITNNESTSTYFKLIIPGFKKKTDGTQMILTDNIPGNTTRTYSKDMSLYNYRELPVYEGFPLVEPYNYQNAQGFLVVLKAFSNNAINLSSTINNEPSTVERLEGKLKRLSLGKISQMIETGLTSDIEDFQSSIALRDASLKLTAQTIGEISNVAVIFEDMQITGFEKNQDGNIIDSTKMLINGSYSYSDSMITGQPFFVEFNQDNTNVTDFLLNFPSSIRIDNEFTVAPVANTTQIISSSDSIKITAQISAPLILAAKEASYDSEAEINLSDDNKNALNDVRSAYVRAEIKNRMPIGVAVRIAIVDRNDNELFTLQNSNGSELFEIGAAQVDEETGAVTNSTYSDLIFSINENQISLLTSSAAKAKLAIFAKTSGGTSSTFGPFVRFRANDYLEYKISAGIVYHVDLEE